MRVVKVQKKGKVRNATKVIHEGILFDSKLELYFYTLLKYYKIDFKLKPEYVLVESFKYMGESVRPMKMYPDFHLTDYNILVDTKGFANEVFPIKLKLLKQLLYQSGEQIRFVVIKNKKEAEAFIKTLLN